MKHHSAISASEEEYQNWHVFVDQNHEEDKNAVKVEEIKEKSLSRPRPAQSRNIKQGNQ